MRYCGHGSIVKVVAESRRSAIDNIPFRLSKQIWASARWRTHCTTTKYTNTLAQVQDQTAQVTLLLTRAPPHPKPNTSLTACLLFIKRRADFGEDMLFCAVKHLLRDARQTTVVTSRDAELDDKQVVVGMAVDMDIGRSWTVDHCVLHYEQNCWESVSMIRICDYWQYMSRPHSILRVHVDKLLTPSQCTLSA